MVHCVFTTEIKSRRYQHTTQPPWLIQYKNFVLTSTCLCFKILYIVYTYLESQKPNHIICNNKFEVNALYLDSILK